MIWIIVGIIAAIFIICLFAWYRIVPQSQAHSVVTPRNTFVASPDENISKDNKKAYFAIPSFIPFIGRVVRIMDITIKELVGEMETYEKDQARYKVTYSLKYRIHNVKVAAETFMNDKMLSSQLIEVIQASVRSVTVKHNVIDARAKKQEMSDSITKEMQDDLAKWGLELVNFQLVDFKDTEQSSIISDISLRREVAIEAITRQQNAEKIKDARVKEAAAEETGKQREIKKDEAIAMSEQNKQQKISQEQKIAEEKRFEVIKVQQIEQANINKEKAKINAEQAKEVQEIEKDRLKLEGEGQRLKLEEEAKGKAAEIREKGLAQAEAKDKLQEALNKFSASAITALTAEQLVEKDKEVGIATAKALESADLKVLSGGNSKGLELAKLIESVSLVDNDAAIALKNKLGRPNDLGFNELPVDKKKGPTPPMVDDPYIFGQNVPEQSAADAATTLLKKGVNKVFGDKQHENQKNQETKNR